MTTMARRRLPDNTDLNNPDVSVAAMTRSPDAQWNGVLRVARSARAVLALSAPGRDGLIAFRVARADGREQTGDIDASGAIRRDPLLPA